MWQVVDWRSVKFDGEVYDIHSRRIYHDHGLYGVFRLLPAPGLGRNDGPSDLGSSNLGSSLAAIPVATPVASPVPIRPTSLGADVTASPGELAGSGERLVMLEYGERGGR